MNKRIRKKKHVKEFAVLGFEFSMSLPGSPEEVSPLLDRFIEFAERRNLAVSGGWGGDSCNMFVLATRKVPTSPKKRKWASTTGADRVAVSGFLSALSGVSGVSVGLLVDAYK